MDKSVKWIYRLIFLLLLFFVIYLFFKLKPVWYPIVLILSKTLIPFGLAAFVAYLLHPVIDLLQKRGMRRSVSILLIYVLFFGGVGFAVYKGMPIILQEMEELIETAPQFTEKYQGALKYIHDKTSNWPIQFKERIDEGILFLENKLESLLSSVMDYVVNVPDFVLLFGLVPLIAFYYLKDWARIKKAALMITPTKIKRQSIAFMRDIEQSLGNYIRGQFIVCVTIGVISALLLWILHVKYSLLLGIIIGVTNIIPYFGPIIGAIPAVVRAAATSTKQVIWVTVVIFGLQFLEGNILSPLIVGKSLHMHPLLIMLSLLIGGELGGIVGLILAVPILSIIKVSVIHAKVHFKRNS